MNSTTIARRQQKEKGLLIENLKRVPIIEVACKKSGVSRASYYRWRQQDKEFAKSAEEALAEGCALISDVAESKIIAAIQDNNLTAAMYWLNHRHLAYRNKLEVATGSKQDEEPLTTEQQEVVKKALALTGFVKEKEGKR